MLPHPISDFTHQERNFSRLHPIGDEISLSSSFNVRIPNRESEIEVHCHIYFFLKVYNHVTIYCIHNYYTKFAYVYFYHD
jgi:hypothetical protein